MTLTHFFPEFQTWLSRITDPRDQERVRFVAPFLLTNGLFLFLMKLGARRQLKYATNAPAMLDNMNAIAGTHATRVAHPDTVEYFLRQASPEELGAIPTRMVRQLVRMRALDPFRVAGRMLIAVDGTGIMTFRTRHCDQCLTQTQGDVTIYYHMVLEGKLVTGNGMAFSAATEFIENPGPDPAKQDCETKAFVRLAAALKAAFPQMSICLLLDSLYLQEPVLALCRETGWASVITFKEGSAPAVWREFATLLEMCPENRLTDVRHGVRREFRWVNDLPFGKETVSAIECVETAPDGTVTRFVWATSMYVDRNNVVSIADGAGRLRWKIENEGFNEQKNGGLNLEHAYSENVQAAKNYYFLLQIAHTIEMLIEKGNLLVRMVGRTLRQIAGGVRKFAEYLKESLRNHPIPAQAIDRDAARRIQIRFVAG